MIGLQAIPAGMSCNNVVEWVGEEVLKEYKNLTQNRWLQVGRPQHLPGERRV